LQKVFVLQINFLLAKQITQLDYLKDGIQASIQFILQKVFVLQIDFMLAKQITQLDYPKDVLINNHSAIAYGFFLSLHPIKIYRL